MNRRLLLKWLVAIPAVFGASSMYAGNRAPPKPKTARELYAAINTLYGVITTADSDWNVTYFEPIYYKIGYVLAPGDEMNIAERALVRCFWHVATSHYERGARRVFWRSVPRFEQDKDYSTPCFSLYMRVAFI